MYQSLLRALEPLAFKLMYIGIVILFGHVLGTFLALVIMNPSEPTSIVQVHS